MKHSLQLKLSQHLTLTPQLQQSIRLLQLSTLELNQEIGALLDENPLLEREDETGRSRAEQPQRTRAAQTHPSLADEAPVEPREHRRRRSAVDSADDADSASSGRAAPRRRRRRRLHAVAADEPSLRNTCCGQLSLTALQRARPADGRRCSSTRSTRTATCAGPGRDRRAAAGRDRNRPRRAGDRAGAPAAPGPTGRRRAQPERMPGAATATHARRHAGPRSWR